MTKLSPEFAFTIKEGTSPDWAYTLGSILHLTVVQAIHSEDGLEMLKLAVKNYPEFIIVHE